MVRSRRESTTRWVVEHPGRALDGHRVGTGAPRTASSAGDERIRPTWEPWLVAAANERASPPLPRACSLWSPKPSNTSMRAPTRSAPADRPNGTDIPRYIETKPTNVSRLPFSTRAHDQQQARGGQRTHRLGGAIGRRCRRRFAPRPCPERPSQVESLRGPSVQQAHRAPRSPGWERHAGVREARSLR